MANEILQKVGLQTVFADHVNDFSPTTANDLRVGTPQENAELQMASVADDAAVVGGKPSAWVEEE